MSARSIFRFAGRVIVVGTLLAFATMVGVQYAKIVHRNVALARTLWSVNDDIAALKAQRQERLRTIHRLEDPQGAIPEIHDRLHMVLPDESIIYLKGHTPPPSPLP